MQALKKEMGDNPTVPKQQASMLALFDAFVQELKLRLNEDDPSDETMKLVLDFIKTQKFDYREASTLVTGKDAGFDMGVMNSLPHRVE